MARTMTQGVPEGGAVPEEPEPEQGQEEAAGRQGAVLIHMELLPELREEELPPEALEEVLPQEEAREGAEAPDGPGAADITAPMDIVRIMEEGTESPGPITGSWQWEAFF